MKKYNRIFTIVIDSLGIGQMDDAKEYGDVNVDTLGHIAESVERFNIPNLQRLGISNLHPIKHVEKADKALGYAMKMAEASVGKDTMTGHWEMMGLHITKPFQTFTDTGFPKELLDELEKRTGHKIVGNKSASGTEILDELAEHQMK
ncbi:MAG: phosphopentomutase, partial [Clostridium butyricum]|nr:phosphopentomutase [Clostridium butyricum]